MSHMTKGMALNILSKGGVDEEAIERALEVLRGEGLLGKLVAAVKERGKVSADVLMPTFEAQGYTRKQVLKALQNAKQAGHLDSDGHVPMRGVGRGSVCTTYWPAQERKQAPEVRRTTGYASVFHYAQSMAATTGENA